MESHIVVAVVVVVELRFSLERLRGGKRHSGWGEQVERA
jgi:hypothetical protein